MSFEQLQISLRDYFDKQPTTGDNVRIEDFTLLSGGFASDVYSFTLRYDEAGETIGQRLVMKAYTDTPDGKDRALKERHALFKLRVDRYPVPGVAAVEIDPVHIGRPFILMEQINGRLLWDLYQEADEAGKQELLRLFVGLLVNLHALGAKVLVPTLPTQTEFALVNREVHTLRGLVKHYHRDEFTPLIDWLYERRKTVPCSTAVVTHRDFHPWNILLTEQGRPFVIDWGWQISDPRFDLAWTLTLMERSGFQDFRDEVLAEYERVTGGVVEELAYFEVLANTRWLMDITNSLLYGVNLRDGMDLAEFRAVIAGWVRFAGEKIAKTTGIQLPIEKWLE